MKKQALSHMGIAQAATKTVATLVTLWGAGWLLPGHAQTPVRSALDERNLQVQGVAAPVANRSQRVALVIGNAAYKDAPLANPVNDARAISTALREAGFTVILRENTDQRGMLTALREFGDKLRAGGTGLFYYAGHGMQIKGRNYLIPVGAQVEREDEVAYSAVDAQAVLDKMEAAGNAANIMILDACRNNPYVRSARSSQAGLAQMDAPVGTLVAFATSPGAVASDGSGQNGLYTQHLLTAVRQPGSKVEDVFKQVRANVRRDSQGKQVPWEATSLEGDFYFMGGPLRPVDTGAAVETALWDAVKTSSLPIELRAYLNRYPTGRYASAARARLAQLQPAAPVAVQVPVAMPNVAAANAARPVGAAPAAPAQPVPLSAAADQAEVDRRTDELLASLASAPGMGQLVKPAAPSTARPAQQTSSRGFSTGDRWRYQVVDKYKNEVVYNINFRVDKVLANGDMSWNGGSIITSPEGNFRRDVNDTWLVRDYSQQSDWVPKELRVGYKQDVKFTATAVRKADNFQLTEEYTGTLVVKGLEKVKVPAGEFEAWRVERETSFTGVQTNGNSRWYGRSVMVGWYVPALRNFVARDHEHRVGSQPATLERVELTSFSVRGAENLALR